MKRLMSGILVFAMILCLAGCGSKYESNAVDSAKSYASSQFCSDFGSAADSLECEVIYSGEDSNGNTLHLIGVRCYWNDAPAASYCVYAKLGSFRNSTQALPSGYDFGENIDSLKALFGIV